MRNKDIVFLEILPCIIKYLACFEPQVYKEGVFSLSLHCAKEAARRHVKKYIEVSTGQVYTADKVGHENV